MKFKINSEMIQQYDDASKNIFLNEDNTIKDIHENIPISDLLKYDNCIIYYNTPVILKDEDSIKSTHVLFYVFCFEPVWHCRIYSHLQKDRMNI